MLEKLATADTRLAIGPRGGAGVETLAALGATRRSPRSSTPRCSAYQGDEDTPELVAARELIDRMAEGRVDA